MTEPELKPCPHCGTQARLLKAHNVYYVVCRQKCNAAQVDKDRAIEKWNRRYDRA